MKYFLDYFLLKVLVLATILMVVVALSSKKDVPLNEVMVKARKLKSRAGFFLVSAFILFIIYHSVS